MMQVYSLESKLTVLTKLIMMKYIIFICSLCLAIVIYFATTSMTGVSGFNLMRSETPQVMAGSDMTENDPAPVSVDNNAGADSEDVLIPAAKARLAPALADGKWINSEPLSAADLRGKVVLLDFWTFGCYNCVNTLPTLKRLDATYRSKGLSIVGIETPELDFERSFNNLAAAVKKRGIEYPVLTDYNNANWDAFKVEAWPTVIILDKAGRIRYRHIGEGAYEMQENVIKTLLADAAQNDPEL